MLWTNYKKAISLCNHFSTICTIQTTCCCIECVEFFDFIAGETRKETCLKKNFQCCKCRYCLLNYCIILSGQQSEYSFPLIESNLYATALETLQLLLCISEFDAHVCGSGGYVVSAGLCKPQGSVLLSVMHPCLHGTVHHCHI